MSPAVVDMYAALFLHVDASPEIVKAVYRALAKLTSPDGGGGHERMKALNDGYAAALDWSAQHDQMNDVV